VDSLYALLIGFTNVSLCHREKIVGSPEELGNFSLTLTSVITRTL